MLSRYVSSLTLRKFHWKRYVGMASYPSSREQSYIMNKCTEMDSLPGRQAEIDTNGEILIRNRNDVEVTGVKVLIHGWVFSISTGWDKLCSELLAFIAIDRREMLPYGVLSPSNFPGSRYGRSECDR